MFSEKTIRQLKDIKADIGWKGQFLASFSDLIISKNAEMYALPISVSKDFIETGGMFNKKQIDCIVVSNTEHEDWEKLLFWEKNTVGNILLIGSATSGMSKNMRKKAESDYYKKQMSIKGALINAAFNRVDQEALDLENSYYDLIIETIDAALAG